jgi:hypothetical protein
MSACKARLEVDMRDKTRQEPAQTIEQERRKQMIARGWKPEWVDKTYVKLPERAKKKLLRQKVSPSRTKM